VDGPAELFLVANARMPSQRAQSLQVAQTSAAFARAGAAVTLLHARRTHTPALPEGTDLWEYYDVGEGARPVVEAIPCLDWIDRVPRRMQYVPARLQELSFARNAARRTGPGSLVLSRELETAWLLTRRGRRGVFLELHRIPEGRLRTGLLRGALERVAGVIAISEGVAEGLQSMGVAADRITVEHDGHASGRFEELPDRARAREQLGLDPERPTVVYTGGLLEWKGVDLLVDAARELDPATQVVIAGGMEADVERLRARAHGQDNVRVDGFQPPSRVPLYMAAGDVGVVPNRSRPAISARYTSPLKVYESMAAGLPLVVSDLPSLRAILGEGEACFVQPDDASALAQGLRNLLEDGARREALGARLRSRADEHTWDARARRLLHWMGERAA